MARLATIALLLLSAGCSLDAVPNGELPDAAAPASGAIDGVPCDIAAILSAHCIACHGSPPAGGAPVSLLTWDELAAPSNADPSLSRAALALTRMTGGPLPMPPTGTEPPVSATELAAWQAWVSAGLPRGSCGGDAGVNPYDTPPVCTSMATWTGGNDGTSRMHPGVACIACHASSGGEAPRFSIAGTAYPTAHEPDDCNGSSAAAAAQVVVTGADGVVNTIKVNSVGNFYLEAPVALPFQAKLVVSGRERIMAAAQTDGDCNGCHTESGANGAPGRILLP